MSGRNKEQAHDWIKEFQLLLEENFVARFKEEGLDDRFIHATQILYTTAIVKNLGLDPKNTIHSGKIAHVINLIDLEADVLLRSRLDFSFGGCGYVYVLNESVRPKFPQLSSEKIVPTLQDKHGGKTWEEWFDF